MSTNFMSRHVQRYKLVYRFSTPNKITYEGHHTTQSYTVFEHQRQHVTSLNSCVYRSCMTTCMTYFWCCDINRSRGSDSESAWSGLGWQRVDQIWTGQEQTWLAACSQTSISLRHTHGTAESHRDTRLISRWCYRLSSLLNSHRPRQSSKVIHCVAQGHRRPRSGTESDDVTSGRVRVCDVSSMRGLLLACFVSSVRSRDTASSSSWQPASPASSTWASDKIHLRAR